MQPTKKQVFWINYAASTPAESGPTRHYEIARRLNSGDSGVHCTVVASSIHHGTQTDRLKDGSSSQKLETVEGVPFFWVRAKSSSKGLLARAGAMLHFSYKLYRALSRSEVRPQVIVGSSPHLLQAFVGYLAARRIGASFILEVRDIWPESLVEIGGVSRFHPGVLFLGWVEKFLYRRASKIFYLLPNFDRYLESLGVSTPAYYLPNAASVEKTAQKVDCPGAVVASSLQDSKPQRVPSNESDSGRTFRFIYAGSHGLAQNLKSLVDAALILKDKGRSDIEIIMLGSGYEKRRLVERAGALALSNVIFLDPVPKEEVRKIIASADAGILHLKNLPLFKWGISPNKLFDYMACEKPVLFAVNTNFDDLEKHAFGIKAEADHPQDLAEKMIALANLSAEERAQMGRRGKELTNTVYSFDHIARQCAEILSAT